MYPLKFHPTLAGRWHEFSRDRQILMIANELNRAKNLLKDAHDPAESISALQRAFELIDLSVESFAGTLRYELLRFREALGQVYVDLTLVPTLIVTKAAETPLTEKSRVTETIANLANLTRVLITLDKTCFAKLSI